MRNTIQKYGRLTALFLAVTLCVSGCGSSGESSLNYRPQMQTGTVVASGGAYSLDYLSQDICVIPKNKQSKEGSDSVMTAGASMIVNDTKQKMLFSKNIYDRMYPASITKIVTALVTLKYGNLDDTVTFSHDAANITEYGAKLCGFKIVLRDLLYSFLVFSGNDAGVAIAEHVGGSVEKFVDMMNDEVKDLGAIDSHFVNPHGLHDDKHYTTVYDLYLVFHELHLWILLINQIIRQNILTKTAKNIRNILRRQIAI